MTMENMTILKVEETADISENEEGNRTALLIPRPAEDARKSSEKSIPHRKVSTSTRFINAFQYLYSGSGSNPPHNGPAVVEVESEVPSEEMDPSNGSCGRTPTRGMESKLLSMWHNVKYGWSGKLKSNFSKEQPVWLLGRCYHRKMTPPSSMENSIDWSSLGDKTLNVAVNTYESNQNTLPADTLTTSTRNVVLYSLNNAEPVDEIMIAQELGTDATENQIGDNSWEEGIEGFRRDFYSRLWLTYRREFPIMNGSNYTSDCGWGCMLRSGQMLFAQGLICHFLGRSWRYDPDTQIHTTYEDNMHKKIVKWFGDSSSKSSPFSIHALVKLGEEMGKKPGDWYGPASVSYLLQQALTNAAQENADFDRVVVYVARECTIYIQDVEEICCIPKQKPRHDVPWRASQKASTSRAEREQHWKSLIILIPLRLGTEKLNPVYAYSLKLLLSTEYCIGVIGGRPKHSLYFVGFQEDKLIHLDPHYCQEMVDVNQETFPLQTFHCKSPRKLKAAKMDPSCCIGFYCQTKADFENFVENVQMYLLPMRCSSVPLDKTIQSSQQMTNSSHLDNTGGAQFAEVNYPLFTFSRGRCMDNEKSEFRTSAYQNIQHIEFNRELICRELCEDEDETEEFVLL